MAADFSSYGNFWITKYALSRGIYLLKDCEVVMGGKYVKKADKGLFCAMGLDAWPTEAEAKARALEMAKAKVRSLQKQITKVQEMIKDWEEG
jgi:hypothetical protein